MCRRLTCRADVTAAAQRCSGALPARGVRPKLQSRRSSSPQAQAARQHAAWEPSTSQSGASTVRCVFWPWQTTTHHCLPELCLSRPLLPRQVHHFKFFLVTPSSLKLLEVSRTLQKFVICCQCPERECTFFCSVTAAAFSPGKMDSLQLLPPRPKATPRACCGRHTTMRFTALG